MTDTDRAFSRSMIKLRVQSAALLISAPAIYLYIGKMFHTSGQLLNHAGWKIELLFYLILLYSLAQFLVLPVMERAQFKMYHQKYKHKRAVFRMVADIHTMKIVLPGAVFMFGMIVLYISGDWWRLIPFYAIGIVTSVMYWPRKQRVMNTLERLEAESA